MTNVTINEQLPDGIRMLEYIRMFPHIAQISEYDADNTPLPYSDDELVSLEEFKANMEELALRRLGLKLSL